MPNIELKNIVSVSNGGDIIELILGRFSFLVSSKK